MRVLVRVGVWMRIRAYSLANPARKAYAPYCDVICGPSVSTTFFDILINGAIFRKKLLNLCFDCLYNFWLKHFLILGRIKQDIVKNVETSSRKVPVIFVGF